MAEEGTRATGNQIQMPYSANDNAQQLFLPNGGTTEERKTENMLSLKNSGISVNQQKKKDVWSSKIQYVILHGDRLKFYSQEPSKKNTEEEDVREPNVNAQELL
jgi:hypothetical protein